MDTKRVPIPQPTDRDEAGDEAGDSPATRCAHWRQGCNGVTGGPVDGHLDLCNDCWLYEQADAAANASACSGPSLSRKARKGRP